MQPQIWRVIALLDECLLGTVYSRRCMSHVWKDTERNMHRSSCSFIACCDASAGRTRQVSKFFPFLYSRKEKPEKNDDNYIVTSDDLLVTHKLVLLAEYLIR